MLVNYGFFKKSNPGAIFMVHFLAGSLSFPSTIIVLLITDAPALVPTITTPFE